MESYPASHRERKRNESQEKRDILNLLGNYGVHLRDISDLNDATFEFYYEGSTKPVGEGTVTGHTWVPEIHSNKGELRVRVDSDKIVSIRPYTAIKTAKVWQATLRNSTGEPVVGVVKFTLAEKKGDENEEAA
jgi:hypothetical protein